MRDFTPVFDVLIKRYGVYTALVYGRIWRYCQGERRECFTKQTKIASVLGISRNKVNSSISTLIGDGFLVSTPIDRVKKSYRLTEKINCPPDEQFIESTVTAHEMGNNCPPDGHPPIKRDSKRGSKRGNASPKKRKRSYSCPPAVELTRRITHRYPPKKLHGMIDRAVGNDVLKWGRIVKTWIASGYNPTNYSGMINVFRHGWNNKQRKETKSVTPGVAALQRAFQKAEVEK